MFCADEKTECTKEAKECVFGKDIHLTLDEECRPNICEGIGDGTCRIRDKNKENSCFYCNWLGEGVDLDIIIG